MTTSSVLKALLLAFAALSSAAPATDAQEAKITLPGGSYCCTWKGCAFCTWGKCLLDITTAEGHCPYKANSGPTPIPSGDLCCKGDGCETCLLGECIVTTLFGSTGTCPWPVDPENPDVANPGEPCSLETKCRFGECVMNHRLTYGFCPILGDTLPDLSQGEACCVENDCAPCAFPYKCQLSAIPNANSWPAGTCQF